MHKLLEYICDELDELERKVSKDGKLSTTEVQYMDTLLHAKKNLLKSEEMYEEGYSESVYPAGSYRNIRRDRMGRYSSGRDKAKEELITGLRELGRDSSDEETRMMVKKWIKQLEQD